MGEETKAEQNLTEGSDVPKKFSGKKWGIIGTVIVVLIALMAGIGIYNTPDNRLSRQLDLGQRYLEEQNYEQAIMAFNKAIAIDDRCLEAYAGGIEAYQGQGDREGLTNLYERALEVTSELGETELADSMESVVAIYLAADDVYGDNPERAMEILEEGLALTGDERIREKLAEDYLELAQKYAEAGDYDKAIEVLEEGYAKTDVERLKARIEEYRTLQAQAEEAAKAARKAEAEQIIDEVNFWGLWQSYWQGWIYLSDTQIRELCEPLVSFFESYLEDTSEADLGDELAAWYHQRCLQELSEIYYLLGEYDLCMEKRWQYYEAYGSFEEHRTYVTPTEHTEYFYLDDGRLRSSYLTDEYGRLLNRTDYLRDDGRISSTEEYEYGENGKCVKAIYRSYNTKNGGLLTEVIYTFEYDSSGRLLRRTENGTTYNTVGLSGGKVLWETYGYSEYEYHEGGFMRHQYTRTVFVNEVQHSGPTVSEGGFYEDFVVDQYGNAESVGDYYGYYGSEYEREALEEQKRNE